MKFKLEQLRDCMPELVKLTSKHYLEIATFQDIPLEPDFEKYLLCEEYDTFKFFTVRDDENILRGYAAFFVSTSVQYKSSLQATQDVLYLDQSLRKQGIGSEFIEWLDVQFKEMEVQVVYHHVKTEHDFSPLLETLGYFHISKVYARRLD